MKIIESIKNHPYLFGGVVIGGLLLVLFMRKTSNAGAVEAPAYVQGSTEQGSAMQIASMQAASQANAMQAQLQDTQLRTQSALAMADLQGKYSTDLATINAGVESLRINKTAENANLQSTLAAQLKGKELETSREIQLGSFRNTENLAQINADLQRSISGNLTNIINYKQASENERWAIAASNEANAAARRDSYTYATNSDMLNLLKYQAQSSIEMQNAQSSRNSQLNQMLISATG